MSVSHAYRNILETSLVTLSDGTADTYCPLMRLYDRDIGRVFKTTSAVSTTILVNQQSTPIAVDRLIIPSGHNLSGATLNIEYSTDNVNWTAAVAQWVGASGLITKSWASLTRQYWRFRITTPSAIPQIAELFLTSTYTWPRNPQRPSGPLDPKFNTRNDVTSGGQDMFLVLGPAKRRREYPAMRCPSDMYAEMLALYSAWGGYKPFWLLDHEGNWIFVKFTTDELGMKEVSAGQYQFDFKTLEVIP